MLGFIKDLYEKAPVRIQSCQSTWSKIILIMYNKVVKQTSFLNNYLILYLDFDIKMCYGFFHDDSAVFLIE